MPATPEEIGLPARPFLYYHDQIEGLLSMTRAQVKYRSYYEGASIHLQEPTQMRWINVGTREEPMWRLEEKELLRWCKRMGIRVRDATWARRN